MGGVILIIGVKVNLCEGLKIQPCIFFNSRLFEEVAGYLLDDLLGRNSFWSWTYVRN